MTFWGEHNRISRTSLRNVTNVKMNDSQFLQAFLTAAKDGWVVSSTRLLALPAFLASAVGAKATSSEYFGLKHENGRLDDKLELWLYSAKFEVAPETEIQKKCIKPNYDRKLSLKLEPVDVESGMFIRISSDRNA